MGCAIIIALPIIFCLWALWPKGSQSSHEANESYKTHEPHKSYEPYKSHWSHEPHRPHRPHRSHTPLPLSQLFRNVAPLDTANISVEVYDLTCATILFSRNADRLAPPASCMKLLTAITAMQFLGTDHQFTSQVLATGQREGGTLHGSLLFVLEDDPMLESLSPLADAVRRAGITSIDSALVLSLMRNDTLKAHPTAATWDIPYNKLPILLKGRERIIRELHPLLSFLSASEFTDMPHDETRLTPDADTIYSHQTSLTDVLIPMLTNSSNIKADALFSHIAQVCNRFPCVSLTPEEYLRCMVAMVDGHRPDFVLNDGSGLSPENRLTAHFLVQLLRYAWEREDMRHILIDQALATPGHPTRHGSLLGRMTAPLYRDRVFVKTGTLTSRGLSSLAGYIHSNDDHWFIFSIINENSPVAESRMFQDRLCNALLSTP